MSFNRLVHLFWVVMSGMAFGFAVVALFLNDMPEFRHQVVACVAFLALARTFCDHRWTR